MSSELVCTEPIDKELKRRYGKFLYLDENRAQKMYKLGLIKINPRSLLKEQIRPEKDLIRKLQPITTEIPIIIPFDKDGNVGKAYNKIMNLMDGWVIFMDHDVLLVNPLWQNICNAAIEKVGESAGLLTCYTNRIGCELQKAPGVDYSNNDILYHRNYAKEIYLKNKGSVRDISRITRLKLSGMFFLTNKKAWIKAGGFFEKGFFTIDNMYHEAIRRAGLGIYIMQDLYVYHGYFRETLKPFFTKE